MSLLQVRNMPTDLYSALSIKAERERRSVAQETIVLLREALKTPANHQERLATIFRTVNANPPQKLGHETDLDPVDLVRQDRDHDHRS
jgi:plasmid stability protein